MILTKRLRDVKATDVFFLHLQNVVDQYKRERHINKTLNIHFFFSGRKKSKTMEFHRVGCDILQNTPTRERRKKRNEEEEEKKGRRDALVKSALSYITQKERKKERKKERCGASRKTPFGRSGRTSKSSRWTRVGR